MTVLVLKVTLLISSHSFSYLTNSKNTNMPESTRSPPERQRSTSSFWSYGLVLAALAPVAIAIVLYHIEPLEPAHYPLGELTQHDLVVPRVNNRLLQVSEFVGAGELVGPEDIAFDPVSKVIYTGCADGWIKRVALNDSVVEKWVNTGGRPLGLAFGLNNDLIIADAFKGLLKVSAQGKVEVLTDEVEGRKLKFADGVDVAKDGMIYFTEASYKYDLPNFVWDLYEGRPHGSLMSFDPTTGQTHVLLRRLYFANGVQVSPDQKFVIFCETSMRRCKKYKREGEGQGTVEVFVDNLPGFVDNIRYDGEGLFWIATGSSVKPYWEKALKYPVLRKGLAIVTRYLGKPAMEKNSGLMALDLDGEPIGHYYDPNLAIITGGYKLGDHLYFGSIAYPYLIRLSLSQHPAT